MSEEKIRITSDDIARLAEPAPIPQQPGRSSAPTVQASAAPLLPSRAKKTLLLAGSGVAVIFILILLISVFGSENVDTWTRHERDKLNTELNTSPKAKSFIEDAQPFSKYTGATVKSVVATTIDGTQNAGRGGSNIAEEVFVVTFHWKSPLEDNGYTEVRFTYDKQADVLKKTEYLDSNALINLNTVDWYKVGFALGTLFGG
jgi:hypothetical protein